MAGIFLPINNLTNHTNQEGEPLEDAIRYIVLTKGVPLKIRQYDGGTYIRQVDYSSVDAAVALLFQEYEIDGRIRNPYYNADPDLRVDSPLIGLNRPVDSASFQTRFRIR